MTKGEVIEYIIKNTDIIHDNKRDEILEYYYNLRQENQMLKLTIEKLTKTPYTYEIRGGNNE